jgi:uncharacterized protein (TIGR02271 family)
MGYEKIVTLYDNMDHAEAARRNLEAAGFAPGEMSIVSNKTLSAAGQTLKEPGFWHRLFGKDIEEHEATVYGRAVDAGGVVLTVRVPDDNVARALGILNAHKVVDVQAKAVQQGLIDASSVPKPAVAPPPPAKTIAAAMGRDEVLRLAEEQLDVGKRLVEEGTTRIRRFVTERPVEARITLHEEHAQVARRAVADPSYVQDIDWTDRTVEVKETAEQAVVSKKARVVEEVVISKEGTDRTETVKDTVRRQQVDVDRTPGKDEPPKKA